MDTLPLSDNNNFNEMSPTYQLPASPNLLLNEKIGGLCMDSSDGDDEINTSSETNEQQLLQVIQFKSARIHELETLLRQKENEIAELKSHLDKFQSVFPFSRGRKSNTRGVTGQRQRAQGISAEPQSESSVLELLHVTFPKYDKDERWVLNINYFSQFVV